MKIPVLNTGSNFGIINPQPAIHYKDPSTEHKGRTATYTTRKYMLSC